MSEAQLPPPQQAIDYLVRLLQMNPAQEGDEIVRTRTKALGFDKHRECGPALPLEAARADRRQLLEALESLRTHFWSLPIDELDAELRALDSRGFDDLEAAIARLRVVAASRARLRALAGKRGFDDHFFSALQEVLIRSPRDTAMVRERVLSTLRDKAQLKNVRRMIALLKSETPPIYRLEADWFDNLTRQKAQPAAVQVVRSSYTRPTSVGEGLRNYWWVLLVASAVLRGMIGNSNINDRNSRGPVPRDSYEQAEQYLRDHRQPEFDPRKDLRDKTSSTGNASGVPTLDTNNDIWKLYLESNSTQSPSDQRSSFPSEFNVNPAPSFPQPNDRFPK